LFFAEANAHQDWSMAYRTDGRLVQLAQAVSGGLPEVSATSGLWAWTFPTGSPHLGLWLGAPTETPRRVYGGAARLPRWTADGKHLLFFDGEGLYLASAPDFNPTLVQTLSPAVVDAVWMWP
jgi:hypothetical protein